MTPQRNPGKTKTIAQNARTNISALAMLALLMAGAAMLSGCNTVEGMGEDVSSAGTWVDETAEDAMDSPDAGATAQPQQGFQDQMYDRQQRPQVQSVY